MPESGGIASYLPQVHKASDLGVIVDNNFKSLTQAAKAVSKAPCMLVLLNRALSHIIPEVFIPANSAFDRSHLEYCIQAWSRSLHGGVRKIGLQRAATRLAPSLRHLPYEVTLERHQVRSDLILILKMINELTNLRTIQEFDPRPSSN